MSGEDKAEARLRELLRDPRWSLPAGPDPEQRVRRAAQRQRLRLVGMAGVAAAIIAVAVAIPVGLGAFGQPSRPEQPPAAPTLYIYGYNGSRVGWVTPVNTATNTPGKPIRIGMTGDAPKPGFVPAWGQIAVTPNGKTAYLTTGSSVTPISTATGRPGKPIHIDSNPFHYPDFIAITPDGKTAYVIPQGSGAVIPISTATNTPGKPIAVGPVYHAGVPIMITPDGKTAYVAAAPGLMPVNTATNKPGKPIHGSTVDIFGENVAFTPDGKTAYVFTGSSVTPIDTATNTAGKPIPVGVRGTWMAITPDGKTAYVSSDNGCNKGGPPDCTFTVTPISIATNTPGTPIKVGSGQWDIWSGQIVITPDGKTAYVATTSGTVIPISTVTNTPGRPIHAGPFSVFGETLAITPDGKTVYVITGSGVTPISTATNKPGKPIRAVAGYTEVTAIRP